MDENFQAKMLIHNMAANEQNIMMRGNAFFCIFPIIVMPASRINRPTAILMPLKALAMTAISRKLSKKNEISRINQKRR